MPLMGPDWVRHRRDRFFYGVHRDIPLDYKLPVRAGGVRDDPVAAFSRTVI